MCKFKLRRWLGTGTLGSVLIVGCHHTEPSYVCPAVNNTPPTAVSTPVSGQPAANNAAQPGAPGITSTNTKTMPGNQIESFKQVDRTVVPPGPTAPAPSVDKLPGYSGTPVITSSPGGQGVLAGPTATYTVPPDTVPSAPAAVNAPTGLPTILTSTGPKPGPAVADVPEHQEAAPVTAGKAVAEAPPAPKAPVTSAANPGYAHAADYAWLTGELQKVHFHNTTTWRLRYAGLDEADPYGGAATLLEVGDLHEFQSGQFVRVEGKMVDSNSREGAFYRVQTLRAITSP